MHQRSHDRGEDDGVYPFVYGLVDLALLAHTRVVAPDVAVEELRDVEVEDHRQPQQHPEIAGPYDEPERVKQRGEREADPFVAEECLDFSHIRKFISAGRPSSRRPACRIRTRRL